ncbi:MAG TPA: PAS domain-containing protein, partial [Pseudomonas sp.]|nr:PAS domain-containing protein [Pseudomonas sp.]
MTQSSRGPSAGVAVEETRAIHQQFATEIAVERTRLLYQGSQVPTLFMLLGGLACAGLLWQPQPSLLLAGWLVWVVLLAVLRLIQMTAFKSALPSRQANPHWRRVFLVGAGLSGLTLAFAAIFLVPADRFLLQALVYGLIAAAILSASVAYAVSRSAFLVFALPCLLPSIGYLLLSDSASQQGWGALGLLMLLSLCVVAWQVNRLVERNLLRRFQNQALIERLEHARESAEGLNQELAREVEQRRRAERELRKAHGELEIRVTQRTLELDDATHALGKSEARLGLALEASELGLWDWNLKTDEVYHSHLQSIFGISQDEVKGVLSHLKPRLHPDDLPLLRRALVDHLKGRTDGYCVEYRVRHADGRWRWVEDRGRAVERDERGQVLRMLGTRRDVTERKRLDEEHRLAATVFEAASEGIVILDADYLVLSVNQAFSEVTGYRKDEVLGRS